MQIGEQRLNLMALDGGRNGQLSAGEELADDMNVDPQIVISNRPEKDTRSPWVATTALT